ncbi:EMC3/TMCO1 family protein, partial [Candidatus Marsarchaeota archaeon]|nr:EMC3/TMCO1 family protein [Candidatus Marsarchaeota archaeon]
MFLLTTMPFYNVEVPIIMIAVAYIIGTLVIQRKAADTKKMRSVQLQIQEITKQLNEMIKNKVPNDEISKKQKEVMPLVTSSLKMQLKPMFIIFPLFMLVYYVMLP